MSNSYKISASLSIFLSTHQNNPSHTFILEIGQSLIGSDPNICKFVIELPEIDKIQAKISIFDYGECSIESLSSIYDNYKKYEPISGEKHYIKMRRNKEYDIFDNSVFYLSKYKALFNIKFNKNSPNLFKNNCFSATLFVPDLEAIEDNKQPPPKPFENSGKFDFLPTQVIDFAENTLLEEDKNALTKSRVIKNIFKQAVEKIKISCREKIEIKEIQEKNITDMYLSKFTSLYDSLKEELTCSKSTHPSLNSNSNSKGFSLLESPNFSSKNFKTFRFSDEKNQKLEENYNENLIENGLKILILKENLEKNHIPQDKNNVNLILSHKTQEYKEIKKKYDDNNENYGKNEIGNLKNSKNLINLEKTPNLSPFIKPLTSEKNDNCFLEPTLKESQIPQILTPTLRESQRDSELCNLAQTIRESQINSNNLPNTLRESQMMDLLSNNDNNLAQTIRESQLLDINRKEQNLENTSNLIQSSRNEEKNCKYIRDSKRNLKKRKMELVDMIKIEKRQNLEKKIQDEQFQSLKLFIKDSIDDLEDLFEGASLTKENKLDEVILKEFPSIENSTIQIENNAKIFEDQKKLDAKSDSNEIPKKIKVKKNFEQKTKFFEEEQKINELSAENNAGEAKIPKLYLSQKSFHFTSNESQNLSSKKKKKPFVLESAESEEIEKKEEEIFYKLENSPRKILPNPINDNSLIKNQEDNITPKSEEKENTEKLEMSNEENEKEKEIKLINFNEEEKNRSLFFNEIPLTNKKKDISKSVSKKNNSLVNRKITKTLTEIFSTQSNEIKFDLNISIFGFKPTKKENEQLRILKINIINDIILTHCDAIIVKNLKKDKEIIIAINKGVSLVTKKWMDDTLEKKAIQLLGLYQVKDTDFEKKHNFFLEQSVLKSRLQGGLLKGYKVWVSENRKDLEKIVESAEGTILKVMPENNEEKTLIIIDEKKRRLISEMVERNIVFFFPDFLIDACLKQELIL